MVAMKLQLIWIIGSSPTMTMRSGRQTYCACVENLVKITNQYTHQRVTPVKKATDGKTKRKEVLSAHDAFFKANLSEKRKVEKLIKQHLPAALVAKIDFKSLVKKPTEFIQHNLSKVVADVLYAARVNGKEAYLYFLWEHQSKAERLMAFRMLMYSLQIMQRHLDQGHTRLPLVIPVVLYHGESLPYPYSTDIRACFEDEALAEEICLGQFTLIDLTTMSDEMLSQFDPDLLFEYMLKHSRERLANLLIGWLLAHPEQSVYFLNAGKNLLNQVFSYLESRQDADDITVDQLIAVINDNTEGEFMNYLQRREQAAKQEGMQHGMQQGVQQGMQKRALIHAQKMLFKGFSIEEVKRIQQGLRH